MAFESANDKMLEADPNFERNVTVHQGIEKILSPDNKLYDEKTKFNVFFITFLQKHQNIFILIYSNALSYSILNIILLFLFPYMFKNDR